MSHAAFSTLSLQPELIANLADLNFEQMTPIQAEALPLVLEGKDVIGQAKTGSGKTAVFGLGILEKLDTKNFLVQSLVLCPTRELAEQVSEEIRRLARPIANVKVITACGGTPLRPQADSLKHGAHIVVGTPGRVVDHLEKETIDLSSMTTFVLDEADRMLDMGFQPALDTIIESLPPKRQTLLFSATYPKQIQSIAERVMTQPVLVKALSKHDNSSIEQDFYKISDEGERDVAVRLLLLKHRPDSTVIFCNTKRHVKDLTQELKRHGFSVLALHGDLEQKERDQALVRFANNSVQSWSPPTLPLVVWISIHSIWSSTTTSPATPKCMCIVSAELGAPETKAMPAPLSSIKKVINLLAWPTIWAGRSTRNHCLTQNY